MKGNQGSNGKMMVIERPNNSKLVRAAIRNILVFAQWWDWWALRCPVPSNALKGQRRHLIPFIVVYALERYKVVNFTSYLYN